MIKQQSGRIINVSSISVKAPVENLVLSNSVRSATLAWAKTLANEIGQYNITINNVLTGYFLTERLEGLIRQEAAERQVDYETVKREKENEVPLKRIGDPKEYGSLVAFLASEYASYITGTNIPIDGGLTKSY
jgi:3-oxoacyl-[acyl-carrier protein] reductase